MLYCLFTCSLDNLARADAVGVVLEPHTELPAVAVHLLELTALPRKLVPVEGGGGADGVIGDGRRANLGQLVAPGVAVLVFLFGIAQRGKRVGGRVCIRFLARAVSGCPQRGQPLS